MLVTLKAGEHLWGTRGSHLCDEHGFAIVLLLDTDVEIDDDVADAALAVIRADREFRGLDPLTGGTLPVVIEPEVIEPEVIEPTPEVVEPMVEVVPIVDGIILEPTPEVVPEPTPVEGEDNV